MRQVATPWPSSGKRAGDENFPVASLLLPARHRPVVMAFYRFARTIDDIADSAALTSETKVTTLRAFAGALTSDAAVDNTLAPASELGRMLRKRGLGTDYGLDLVHAFEWDATRSRHASWNELMDYCTLSAVPVGRFLVDLHGGPQAAYSASDSLCCALQVINHLQDCGEDYRTLSRVYLPQEWMRVEGASYEMLSERHLTPGLRRVLDRCLMSVRALLQEAAPLVVQLASFRLAMEASVICCMAQMLTRRLALRDPLAERIVLGPRAQAWCVVRGLAAAVWQRAVLRRAWSVSTSI